MNRYQIEHAIFSKIALIKKCRSCFRCEEVGHWRDLNFGYSKKPSKDAFVRCPSACSPDIGGDQYHKACEWYIPRWYYNMCLRFSRMKYFLGRWYCETICMRIGALRKPVRIRWVDGLTPCGDIAPKSDPECPYCGEMPYSLEQCQFCGQRFIQEDEQDDAAGEEPD